MNIYNSTKKSDVKRLLPPFPNSLDRQSPVAIKNVPRLTNYFFIVSLYKVNKIPSATQVVGIVFGKIPNNGRRRRVKYPSVGLGAIHRTVSNLSIRFDFFIDPSIKLKEPTADPSATRIQSPISVFYFFGLRGTALSIMSYFRWKIPYQVRIQHFLT